MASPESYQMDKAERDTLVVLDDDEAEEFIALPRRIMRDRRLTRHAKILYAILLDLVSDAGWCYTDTFTLGTLLGRSEPPARGYLRQLTEAGIVQRFTRGQGRPSLLLLWGDGPEPTPRRRRAKETIPADLRWAVWERDNFTCQEPGCGARTHLSVDHIVPESRGGALSLENLRTLCRACNAKKGAR